MLAEGIRRGSLRCVGQPCITPATPASNTPQRRVTHVVPPRPGEVGPAPQERRNEPLSSHSSLTEPWVTDTLKLAPSERIIKTRSAASIWSKFASTLGQDLEPQASSRLWLYVPQTCHLLGPQADPGTFQYFLPSSRMSPCPGPGEMPRAGTGTTGPGHSRLHWGLLGTKFQGQSLVLEVSPKMAGPSRAPARGHG